MEIGILVSINIVIDFYVRIIFWRDYYFVILRWRILGLVVKDYIVK